MNRNLPLDSSSSESEVFYVDRSSEDGSPFRINTPAFINSTQLSRTMARETVTTSSVASPEPQIVTIDSDSNEPKILYGFGNQHAIVPPNLNDLYLPPNPFKVLTTIAVIQADKEYSLQSPERSHPSPISTPPMSSSTLEVWETPDTTIDEKIHFILGVNP